jgi:twitching motility protein PilT
MATVDEFIKSLASAEGVSDIHLKVGRPPLIRTHGTLAAAGGQKLGPGELEALAKRILGEQNYEKFLKTREYDTAFSLPGFARFRVSAYQQRGTISLVMRIIPFSVPDLDTLRLPPIVKNIALSERGLILVTGITGSGKSSTLAGMINHINQNRPCNVITIEDPVEFLHRDANASINQREVGIDTESFANAFRGALRQDPDVILVGELRDVETMGIALQAAETGHTVMSTVHTTDARETIGRFVDVFPPYQQHQVRLQLAANLRAVISQRLLARADGKGRVLAAEVMIATAAIKACILDPIKYEEIVPNMQKGKDQYGMQTFDQALLALVEEGLITIDEALKNATSPNDLRLKIDLR